MGKDVDDDFDNALQKIKSQTATNSTISTKYKNTMTKGMRTSSPETTNRESTNSALATFPTLTLELPTTEDQNQLQGYNITKAFYFLCNNCKKTFIKLLIVELTHQEAGSFSKYKPQHLFNSSQNASATCPFCNKRTGLILKTNLMIGSTRMLDYNSILQNNKNKDPQDMGILEQ